MRTEIRAARAASHASPAPRTRQARGSLGVTGQVAIDESSSASQRGSARHLDGVLRRKDRSARRRSSGADHARRRGCSTAAHLAVRFVRSARPAAASNPAGRHSRLVREPVGRPASSPRSWSRFLGRGMWTVDLHTARKGLWLALGIVAISAAAAAGASSGSGGGTITTIARLSGPGGVAVDRSGNVLFADGDQVRKRDTRGAITTIAGTGKAGWSPGPPTPSRK